jgi:hypothetical protein
MTRQDVPYGGAICRLKERIAEIWDKLGEKLHSINGVEGDGAGDVKLISGDPAVVISNDRIGHKIKVGLDKSKLPGAAVSSVNGKTGAVRLDAADIPSDGNSDVQADIAANKEVINGCIAFIASEQTARENADAALQTNINAARASIPEISITPDPYKGIKRDAQGRAFAADPASGATDKTLVTANWVSQTGDSSPNNLIHKSGNETKNGKLTLNNGFKGYPYDWHFTGKTGQAVGEYCIFAEIETAKSEGRFLVIDFIQGSNTATAYGRLVFRCNKDAPFPLWAFRKTNGNNNPLSSTAIHVISDGTKLYLAWKKEAPYGRLVACEMLDINYGSSFTLERSNVTWYENDNRIIVADLSAYTDYQVIE